MIEEGYLLACPFCGGEPLVSNGRRRSKNQYWIKIICSNCRVSRHHYFKDEYGGRKQFDEAWKKVFDCWNQRINIPGTQWVPS